MSNVAFSLDWLKCTFKSRDDIHEHIPLSMIVHDSEESEGIGSYNQGISNNYFTLSWHSERPEMKVMLQMTGKQLSEFRKSGGDIVEVLLFCIRRWGTFTRLDFAVDIMDSGGKPEDLYARWQTSGMITSARTASIITGKNEKESTGTTVYIGSRQSLRMMRVYEKGKQMGMPVDWLRAELEFKGARANQMAQSMCTYGVANGGVTHMRKFVQLTDIEWFENALEGDYEVFDIDAIGRPQTDHDKWIFEVVIPAIEKSVARGLPGVLEVLRAIVETHDNNAQHGPSLTPQRE